MNVDQTVVNHATATVGAVSFSWGARSDIGQQRTANEDAFLASPPVFAVCDGMGGHQRGELASEAAVDALRDALRHAAPSRSLPGIEDVVHALSTASQAVAELAHGAQAPPGTTVTGLCLVDQEGHARWLVFNIGDSRTYRLGAHGFERITIDHSLVQEMADIGLPVDAGLAHVITRAIGGGWDQACMPDCWLLTLEHGDRFLSCSDGLTTELSDEEIAEVLLDCDSPQDAADRLVARANETGGRDNITALVVDVTTAAAAPRLTQSRTADEEVHDTVDLTALLPLAPRGLSTYRLPQED